MRTTGPKKMPCDSLSFPGRILLLLCCLGFLAVFQACNSSSSTSPDPATPPGPDSSALVRVSGQVFGSGGLEGVTISAGGKSTTSDTNGMYSLAEIPVPEKGRLVLTYTRQGYATYQRSLPVEGGKSYAASAKMTPFTLSEMNQDTGQDILLEDSEKKIRLELPQGSITGVSRVNVSMAVGDPTTTEGAQAFPGDYMAATGNSDTPDTPLESIAFTEITLQDPATGNVLTTLAKPATVKLKLPDPYQQGGERAGAYVAGDPGKGSIEWWSYDETKGTWLREDANPETPEMDNAEIIMENGILYAVAKISHFSWWNADRPISEHACICVFVKDEAGGPLQGIEVTAQGITYSGVSQPTVTDATGKACITVERTQNTASPVKVRVIAKTGAIVFPYGSDVEVWTTQGSTLNNSGTCMNLPAPILIAYEGTISGTVRYADSLQPAPDTRIHTSFGPSVLTDTSGRYTIKVPLNADISLFVTGLASQSVKLSAAEKEKEINFDLPNRSPVIASLTRSPEGLLPPGASVTLTATASDPDGDTIRYAWSATAGSLSSETGGNAASHTTTWTAPQGIGTATLTLTVTDSKGTTDQKTLSLAWGGTTSSSLKITIKDDPKSNRGIAGVWVVLHGSDGRSITRSLRTDASGVADFGDIGGATATLTIAHEKTVQQQVYQQSLEREVQTLAAMPAGDWVYYMEYDSDFQMSYCQDGTYSVAVPLDFGTYTPVTGDTLNFSPYFASQIWTPGMPTSPLIRICSEADLQTDGKFSVLGMLGTYEGSAGFTWNRYGFLIDQDPRAASTATMMINRIPVTTGWSSSIGLTQVGIMGAHKGQYFPLGSAHQNSPANSGVFSCAADMSVAKILAMGSSYSDSATEGWSSKTLIKHYASIPSQISFTFPDRTIEALAYDKTTQTLTWTLGGSASVDTLVAEVNSYGYGTDGTATNFSWSATLPAGSTSWRLPLLPDEIAAWIPSMSGDHDHIALNVEDFSAYSGYDAVIRALLLGDMPLEKSDFYSMDYTLYPEGSREPQGMKNPSFSPPSTGLRRLIRH